MAEPQVDVSVIVAVRNGATTLRQCIDSVLGQEGCTVELIIVDAMSDDGTQEIVESYGDRIATYVRDPDTGIADAWNKAITFSRAAWCIFLGSDDWLLNSRVLECLLNSANQHGDPPVLVHGGVIVGDESEAWGSNPNPKSVAKFVQSGRMLPHQGMLHHVESLTRIGGFNPEYQISACFDATLRLLQVGTVQRCPETIAFMRTGGLSTARRHRRQLWSERWKISRRQLGLAAAVTQGVRFRMSALLLPLRARYRQQPALR